MGKLPEGLPDEPGDKTVDEVPFVFGETGLATPAIVRRAVLDSAAPTRLIEAVRPQVIGAVRLRPPEPPPALEYSGSANPKGISLLESGDIEGFNALRKKYDGWKPDLRGIDLSRRNLSGIDLHDAILERINCAETDFTGANLSKAELEEADMTGALLVDADLSRAHCKGTVFRGVDFMRAKLSEAICSFAVFVSVRNLTVNQLFKCLLNHVTSNSDIVYQAMDLQKSTVRRLRE